MIKLKRRFLLQNPDKNGCAAVFSWSKYILCIFLGHMWHSQDGYGFFIHCDYCGKLGVNWEGTQP